jgi:hypothetical protein
MLREITEKLTIVIPILIGNISLNEIPDDLRGKHYIDLRFNFRKKYESAWHEILTAIASVRLSMEPLASGEEAYPVGPLAVAKILSFGFTGVILPFKNAEGSPIHQRYLLQKLLNLLLDNEIWEMVFDKEQLESMMPLNEFVEEYGQLAALELIGALNTGNFPPQDEELIDFIQKLFSVLCVFKMQQRLLGELSLPIYMLIKDDDPRSVKFKILDPAFLYSGNEERGKPSVEE